MRPRLRRHGLASAPGGDIGEVCGKAKGAVGTIATIDAAWVALANITRFATIDKRYAALRITSATPDQWKAAGLEERRDVDAWVVVPG